MNDRMYEGHKVFDGMKQLYMVGPPPRWPVYARTPAGAACEWVRNGVGPNPEIRSRKVRVFDPVENRVCICTVQSYIQYRAWVDARLHPDDEGDEGLHQPSPCIHGRPGGAWCPHCMGMVSDTVKWSAAEEGNSVVAAIEKGIRAIRPEEEEACDPVVGKCLDIESGAMTDITQSMMEQHGEVMLEVAEAVALHKADNARGPKSKKPCGRCNGSGEIVDGNASGHAGVSVYVCAWCNGSGKVKIETRSFPE